MAEAKVKTHDPTTDKNHPAKKALDAFGGDPLAPNDAMLERIAKSVKTDKEDDQVSRWAVALSALFTAENPPNTPKRILLAKIADYVSGDGDGGPADAEVEAWAGGAEKKKQLAKSDHNLDHLQ